MSKLPSSSQVSPKAFKAKSHFLRAYETSMAQFTDAPAVYHRASAYGIFGALLTRWRYRCILEGGVPPRWTNLWILLVGDSGENRKSTAVRMASDVLHEIDQELVAPNDGSPEGFLQNLVKKERALKGNATTFVEAPEFATLLAQFTRSYSLSLKPLLMDFYDVPHTFKRQLAKQEFIIPHPRVSMLGAIATELLAPYTSQDDWLGGFFSRTMLIDADRTRTLKRAGTPGDSVVAKHAFNLKGALRLWFNTQKATKRRRFDFSKDAVKVLEAMPQAPDETTLKLSLTRAGVHLMKCAAIEQIDEDPTALEIGRAATERASELVLHWWNRLPKVIEQCYSHGRQDFEGDRLSKRIFRYVEKFGAETKDNRVSYRDVMRGCGIHSEAVSKAVTSLIEAGMLEKNFDESTDSMWLTAVPGITKVAKLDFKQ